MLDKENSSGLLNLSDEVLAQLKEKHPVPAEIEEECLLQGPLDLIPPGIFDLINEQWILDSALKTKGSAGPSGMDAKLSRQEPISWSMQLPYWAYVTAFLQTELFLAYLLFSKIKAGPLQWHSDVN